jgi:hypothetical protein
MSGLFGSKTTTPTVVEPTVMPIANDTTVEAAKKKSIAKQKATQGRTSTILSTTDKLG